MNWQQFCTHNKQIPLDGLPSVLGFSVCKSSGHPQLMVWWPSVSDWEKLLLSHSLQAAVTQKIQMDCTAKSLLQGGTECWKGIVSRWESKIQVQNGKPLQSLYARVRILILGETMVHCVSCVLCSRHLMHIYFCISTTESSGKRETECIFEQVEGHQDWPQYSSHYSLVLLSIVECRQLLNKSLKNHPLCEGCFKSKQFWIVAFKKDYLIGKLTCVVVCTVYHANVYWCYS